MAPQSQSRSRPGRSRSGPRAGPRNDETPAQGRRGLVGRQGRAARSMEGSRSPGRSRRPVIPFAAGGVPGCAARPGAERPEPRRAAGLRRSPASGSSCRRRHAVKDDRLRPPTSAPGVRPDAPRSAERAARSRGPGWIPRAAVESSPQHRASSGRHGNAITTKPREARASRGSCTWPRRSRGVRGGLAHRSTGQPTRSGTRPGRSRRRRSGSSSGRVPSCRRPTSRS